MPTCAKCNKPIKFENRLCLECNRVFHPGCADSYIKTRSARMCCFNSFVAAQKEAESQKLRTAGDSIQSGSSLCVSPHTPLFSFKSLTLTSTLFTTTAVSTASILWDSPSIPLQSSLSLASSSSVVTITTNSPATLATPSTGTTVSSTMTNFTNSVGAQQPLNAQLEAELSHSSALSDADKISAKFANTLNTNRLLNSLTTKVEEHDVRLNEMEQELIDIKHGISSSHPHLSSAEIMVAGLPAIGHDKSDDVLLLKLFEFIGASRFLNDVISFRRFEPSKRPANTSIPHDKDTFALILRFKSVQVRNEVMRLKISKGDVFINSVFPEFSSPVDKKIFLNEWLSAATYKLLKSVKSLAKAKKYERFWVRNETIYVRKNPSSEQIPISSELDLSKLL